MGLAEKNLILWHRLKGNNFYPTNYTEACKEYFVCIKGYKFPTQKTQTLTFYNH